MNMNTILYSFEQYICKDPPYLMIIGIIIKYNIAKGNWSMENIDEWDTRFTNVVVDFKIYSHDIFFLYSKTWEYLKYSLKSHNSQKFLMLISYNCFCSSQDGVAVSQRGDDPVSTLSAIRSRLCMRVWAWRTWTCTIQRCK